MSKADDEMTVVELEPRMVKGKAQAFFMGELEKDGKEVWVWLPLSQIEIEPVMDSTIVEVSMPEWLAKDKDLI